MELKRFFAPLRMTAEKYPLFLSTPPKEGSCHNRISSLPPLPVITLCQLKYHTKLTYYQNPATVYEERCGAVCKTIA